MCLLKISATLGPVGREADAAVEFPKGKDVKEVGLYHISIIHLKRVYFIMNVFPVASLSCITSWISLEKKMYGYQLLLILSRKAL